MDRLPEEILAQILSTLPLKSLFRCMAVSTKFRHTILHNPLFARMHFLHSTQSQLPSLVFADCNRLFLINFNPNNNTDTTTICFTPPPGLSVSSVLSCHGLLCLCEAETYNPVCVANLLTGEHILLPPPTQPTCGNFITGFGFDEINNEYKVVRTSHMIEKNGSCWTSRLLAEVYTVGSNVWRVLGSIPPLLPHNFGFAAPVSINGALHWLGGPSSSEGDPEWIVAWHVKDEEFYTIPLPGNLKPSEDYCELFVTQYRNCLALLVSYPFEQLMTLWMLKDYRSGKLWMREEREVQPIEEWDNEECWTKEVKIHQHHHHGGEDEEMVVKVMYSSSQASFIEVKERGDLNTPRCHYFKPHIATHVGSFISVPAASQYLNVNATSNAQSFNKSKREVGEAMHMMEEK